MFSATDLQFHPLTLADHGKDVAVFFERNHRYFTEVEKRTPDQQLVEEAFVEVPAGVELEQKLLLGVYREERLVSFIELIKDRHRAGEWLLGLLVVDADQRRQGLGARVVNALERYLQDQGAQCVLLGVVEGNTAADAFWTHQNYVRTESLSEQGTGADKRVVRAFYKDFPPQN